MYEDFVQEHLIVSPNKNGEVLTSGGSDIIRQEEQGSNCNIVFESNSTASKSTRTTGGLALQSSIGSILFMLHTTYIYFYVRIPLLLLMNPSA